MTNDGEKAWGENFSETRKKKIPAKNNVVWFSTKYLSATFNTESIISTFELGFFIKSIMVSI